MSSKTAGHGQFKDGSSQVPCTGISATGSHHCTSFRLPPLLAAVPAFHHPKTFPVQVLDISEGVRIAALIFYVSSSKGSAGIPGGVFRPDLFGLLAILVPFCISQTPGFQSSSSGPAAVVTLEGREGWDPYWKWNKQSDSLSTVG